MTTTRKIALEEHFMAPGFQEYTAMFFDKIDTANQDDLAARLDDFDRLRLEEMDRHGIETVVLSQSGPSVQAEADTARAIRRARENNEYLATRMAPHGDRYAGFATLAMQDPKAAADELEYAVRELGFKGALINGHSNGVYYDEPAYDVFWERMQDLDVPLYLHPINPWKEVDSMRGHPELAGAVWGWGVETGTHALRLLFGGVFDRFPNLKIILGHMGEGLPFMRWRFDSRFPVYAQGVSLDLPPSQYFGRNIVITTSGVCSAPTLMAAIGEMGEDAVLFSVDYPYESTELAARFIEEAPISDAVREKVCRGNAKRLLKL
ncbi:MAG: amidohydrolase [Alcanivorax sp.]|nr:amidohydrolase [Alcanivorax sp.]